MRLFITGASGFLGRAVCGEALARGHEIVALTRSATPTPGAADTAVDETALTWVRGDIREPDAWRAHLAGADAVVHLAASLDGAADDQLAIAIDGTRALVDAMADAGVERLVHISSLAVYDLAALDVGDIVDETTPVEIDPARRDAYTAAKLAQDVEAQRAPSVVLLRPGLLWDRDHHWNGGAALGLAGRLSITIAPRARPPLCHVDDCARAVVTAAERPDVTGVVNLVDPAAPDRRTFAANLRSDGVDLPPTVPMAYGAVDAVARAAWALAGPLKVRNRLPGLLRPAQVAARAKPLRYSSTRSRDLIDW
jgi:nucleoside-diphosphate-sugar epimerase